MTNLLSDTEKDILNYLKKHAVDGEIKVSNDHIAYDVICGVSTVTHSLKVLEEAGLISRTCIGRLRTIRLEQV